MRIKNLIIFASIWAFASGSFQDTLNSISNELEQIQNNSELNPIKKYARTIELRNKLERLIQDRDIEKKKLKYKEVQVQLEEKKLEKQMKLESVIFQKFLSAKMGNTSFSKDFHTMRYR